MKIVFMGTPDFALPSLKALIESGHKIAAVFCQADKPKGRGYKLTAPPVKEYAVSMDIPVYQPDKLRGQEELMRCLEPEAIVVAAYGKLLPKAILDIPKHGCINVHASLLPKYRGAAPIQWSVINGDPVTGITTMLMAEGLDTGDILLQRPTEIAQDETSGDLFIRLAEMGAELITETLDRITEITPTPQDDSLSSHAPMLSREHSAIDPTKSAQELHNLIRGLSPWPAAVITVGDKRLKIYRSCITAADGTPGQIANISGRPVLICGDGGIELTEVQPEGKRRMTGAEFLNGYDGQLPTFPSCPLRHANA
ncbi:MAG: methionyl-tRNA formyltransferase [Oscillospiraceae bacterium]|nr:methionyl-tRNA formyltransferase [Oscillospiraceae bacterium]